MTNTERDCWWQIARAAYYAGFKYVAEYIRVVHCLKSCAGLLQSHKRK